MLMTSVESVVAVGQMRLSLGEAMRTRILHALAAEGDDDHVRALLTSSIEHTQHGMTS